jgi:hypothetical protein
VEEIPVRAMDLDIVKPDGLAALHSVQICLLQVFDVLQARLDRVGVVAGVIVDLGWPHDFAAPAAVGVAGYAASLPARVAGDHLYPRRERGGFAAGVCELDPDLALVGVDVVDDTLESGDVVV